jgi:hypothetical protein
MRAIILIFVYFAYSMYKGISQYIEYGELTTTYMVITSIVFVLSIALNLLFSKAYPGTIAEELAIIGGGVVLLIIIQTAIFYLASPLFINFHKLPTWKIILGILLVLFIGKIVFSHLTKGVNK